MDLMIPLLIGFVISFMINFIAILLILLGGQLIVTMIKAKFLRGKGYVAYIMFRKNAGIKIACGKKEDILKWKKDSTDQTLINQVTIHYWEGFGIPLYILIEGTPTNINMTTKMKDYVMTVYDEDKKLDSIAVNMNKLFPPVEMGKLWSEMMILQYAQGINVGKSSNFGKIGGQYSWVMILIAVVALGSIGYLAYQTLTTVQDMQNTILAVNTKLSEINTTQLQQITGGQTGITQTPS